MLTTVKILLIVLAAVLAILSGAAVYACGYAINRPKKQSPPTEEIYIKRAEIRRANNQRLYDLNPEDLTIKSVHGLDMRAWFLPAEKETNKFVICVHGHKCNGPDEFSHMMPLYHYDLGFNYLLPDLTAHGRSDGKYIGFGSYDSDNILLWVNYLIDRFGKDIEIVLHGISMGAATVMLCNEKNPPEQVKLVIEDCGYTSAFEEMNDTLKGMIGFKFKPLVKMASLVCKIKAGYFFEDADPLGNMDKAKNPMLFIHGESDTYVPFEFGKKLYEACPVDKDYMWVPDTIHAFSYYNAKEQYDAKVKSFIAQHMGSEAVKTV
ncbi:MAG: alpha/beta hydrolase [Clostridia bacterium]|nr:alpha/beta hydrolase [Clostridia bacterium]